MDQVRIGRFIAEMRKTQNLTQRQLAERLSISDKTISKWECGKGLPEVSLMLPLCEALHITVNDLLSGEQLSDRDYRERAEQNMVDLIKENEENKKRMILSIICGVITLFSGSPSTYRRSGRAGGEGRLLRVPKLRGPLCPHHGRLYQRVSHPHKAKTHLPSVRKDRHVPPPRCEIAAWPTCGAPVKTGPIGSNRRGPFCLFSQCDLDA